MGYIHPVLGAVAIVGFAGLSAVQAQQCATCDHVVVFERSDVACLARRLTEQLAGARDPILISIQSCKGSNDPTRQEMVPVPRPRQQKSALNRVFILTRADAICLSRRLETLPKSQREFRIELNACRA